MRNKQEVAELCLAFIGAIEQHCDPNSSVFETANWSPQTTQDHDLTHAVMREIDLDTSPFYAVRNIAQKKGMSMYDLQESIIWFANEVADTIYDKLDEATKRNLKLVRQALEATTTTLNEFNDVCAPVARIVMPDRPAAEPALAH